jgi:hypothetical protein
LGAGYAHFEVHITAPEKKTNDIRQEISDRQGQYRAEIKSLQDEWRFELVTSYSE